MRKEEYITERRISSGLSFRVVIPYYDQYGKRVQFSRSFATANYTSKAEAKKAAIRCRDEMLHKLNTSAVPIRTTKTVADVFEMSIASRSLAPETERQHRIIFSSCIPEQLQQMPIHKLKTFDVKTNLAEIAKVKTDAAVKRTLTLWRQICETALDAELIERDFMRAVRAPKSAQISTKREKVMTYPLETVLDAIANYGANTNEGRFNREIMIGALTVCAALGLRPAETFALRKDDVDLIARTVSVGYRVGTGEDTITGTLIGPKTEGSLRTLPLPEQLLPVFQRIARMQDSDFLFAKWDGSLWSSRSRSGYIRGACRKAGIEFTSYQLRHQFSTDLVTAGVDLRTVQELMGHASGTMTLSYARSNDKLKREAIEERMQTAKA
ncbi:MAG: tyrosine-type recombinase/integrase [Lachnospiraceae bacterium]|nr:tyrosine-type recombinase/integrase [Lachnospiraceae bacterium]